MGRLRRIAFAIVSSVLCCVLGSVPASAAGEADVVVKVVDARGKPLKGLDVRFWVKGWPGGTFRSTNHEATTDAKGLARVEGAVPPGTRYGVTATVAAKGWLLASHYHWDGKGGPMPEVKIETAPAQSCRLRFTDDAGKPVAGALAVPRMRAAADGRRHDLFAAPADDGAPKSGADGTVVLEHFLPGEWAGASVRFPGGGWETRHFVVPPAKGVVEIPRTQAPTPEHDLRAGGDELRRYFLFGPKAGDSEPAAGWGLVLVLPGGDGSAEFREWVRERYDDWADAGVVFAQLVAPKWTPGQEIVWPTAASKVPEAKFTTEEFVESVVEDVGGRLKVDPKRVVTVSWSSSGPACHRIASLAKTRVTGSLIAMSVFRRSDLEDLSNVKGRPVFLLHAPGDRRCPFRLAEEARDTLTKAGAKVRFETYEGDHGWGGDSVELARKGLLWLLDPAR